MDLYKLQFRKKGSKTWNDLIVIDPMMFKGKMYNNESAFVCPSKADAEEHIRTLKKGPKGKGFEYRAVPFED
jgi:hypothetical protein